MRYLRARFPLMFLVLLVAGVTALWPANSPSAAASGQARAAPPSAVSGPAPASVPIALRASRAQSTAASSGSSTGGGWPTQTSGTTSSLYSLACPSVTACYAAGDVLLQTTDGGHSWRALTSPSTAALFGIACPAMQTCYAIDDIGAIYKTTDGGHSWVKQRADDGINLNSVACPSVSVCYAVGGSGNGAEILATTDGGETWSAQPNPKSVAWGPSLEGISCPSMRACFTVGDKGTILATTDGGQTWTSQTSGTTNTLWSVSCPTTAFCAAVGDSGTLLRTVNGGASWAAARTVTQGVQDQPLHRVVCTDTQVCHAVGGFGTVALTTNGGQEWDQDTQTTTDELHGLACPSPSVCYASGLHGTILTTTHATSAKSVTKPPTCTPFHPKNAATPGRHIYFVRGPYIYVASRSGGNVHQVTHTGSAKIPDRDPAISPDGRELAYTHQYRGGGIWVMPASGGTARSLSGADFLASLPSWSPDGRAVAYNMEFPCLTCSSGSYSLAIMARSYPKGKALAARYGLNVAPAWSGDGCSFIYAKYTVSSNPTTYWTGLATQNILTEKERLLTHDSSHNDLFPSVSPDGRHIAYVRTTPRTRAKPDSSATGSLWVMNAAGTGARELASPVDTARPAWSPDGSSLAVGYAGSIYAVPAKGGSVRLVIKDGSTPAWGR